MIKTILTIATLALASSVAMADGFRCQGNDFRVQMYNEVQPDRGTSNPAVLIVYERSVGTVATLESDEIQKTADESTVSYQGQTNGYADGRFIFVKLTVSRSAEVEGPFAGLNLAHLVVNANGESRESDLACERYLKHP